MPSLLKLFIVEAIMSRKSKREKLIISDEKKELLISLSQSRTRPLQEVQRSNISTCAVRNRASIQTIGIIMQRT
jgi:hypothetical protein